MLLAKLDRGADAANARWALEMATREGAACLVRVGEIGQLSVGAAADIAVWDLNGVQHAGVLGDPVEGWLRCGPIGARDTIVNGSALVRHGDLQNPEWRTRLESHQLQSRRMQGYAFP